MDTELEEFLKHRFDYDCNSGLITNRKTHKVYTRVGNRGYIRVPIRFNGKHQNISAHRLIWLLHYGEFPKTDLDHIDLNKTNNRIDNLRLADSSKNLANTLKRCNLSSSYKGVRFYKPGKKWQAQIKLNYKSYHLGYFTDEAEAAKAYDRKAIELFGEFALTNFPKENYQVKQ